jgi:hypothetical protein
MNHSGLFFKAAGESAQKLDKATATSGERIV